MSHDLYVLTPNSSKTNHGHDIVKCVADDQMCANPNKSEVKRNTDERLSVKCNNDMSSADKENIRQSMRGTFADDNATCYGTRLL